MIQFDGRTMEERQADRDALAAKMFPVEWARATAISGPKARNARHGLRRKAEYAEKVRPLRENGASCASCLGFQKGPPGIKGMICGPHSDFKGYQLAKPDGLCDWWAVR